MASLIAKYTSVQSMDGSSVNRVGGGSKKVNRRFLGQLDEVGNNHDAGVVNDVLKML
jgi:hypothetical protein